MPTWWRPSRSGCLSSGSSSATRRTGWNGEWRDAAKLIKVDKSPVTREWTADPNTGTSNRNEAIWVMTSDQVEFSTGWTCTARIAARDDAVKFLHNYPSGSLQSVMDTEVRAKLQAEFGLEVTDLPMDELRKNATPHLKRVVEALTTFFSERGITITNLGITGRLRLQGQGHPGHAGDCCVDIVRFFLIYRNHMIL